MKDSKDAVMRICSNINTYGLARFDPRDIDDIVERKQYGKYMRIILQIAEAYFPYGIRSLFHCTPRLFPTTYTFLAESLLETPDLSERLGYSVFDLMDQCINEYYEGNGYWKYKENTSFYVDKSVEKQPSMPLYMVSRINNVLARVGMKYGKQEYIDISKKSLGYVCLNHRITYYGDGSCSISYYYNSQDCTLNVNSEVAEWISVLSDAIDVSSFLPLLNGIVKLIHDEQNEDGSWFYFSKQHINVYKSKSVIDCHHSATVLYNLIRVYKRNIISKDLQSEIVPAIKKGMDFFVDGFLKRSQPISIIGKKRKASSAQYGESMIALKEFITSDICDEKQKEEYTIIAESVARKMERLVLKNGSCPGDDKLKLVNVNCINWGNGPVLLGLCKYRSILEGEK